MKNNFHKFLKKSESIQEGLEEVGTLKDLQKAANDVAARRGDLEILHTEFPNFPKDRVNQIIRQAEEEVLQKAIAEVVTEHINPDILYTEFPNFPKDRINKALVQAYENRRFLEKEQLEPTEQLAWKISTGRIQSLTVAIDEYDTELPQGLIKVIFDIETHNRSEFVANSHEALKKMKDKVDELYKNSKGEYIGVIDSSGSNRYNTNHLVTGDLAIKMLARGDSPVFDNSFIELSNYPNDTRAKYYIGRHLIAEKRESTSDHFNDYDSTTRFSIGDTPATRADLEAIVKYAEKHNDNESYNNKHQLPNDIAQQVAEEKKIVALKLMENTLKRAVKVNEGEIELKDIYGSSHFGSGGSYGNVSAYKLSDWKKV